MHIHPGSYRKPIEAIGMDRDVCVMAISFAYPLNCFLRTDAHVAQCRTAVWIHFY